MLLAVWLTLFGSSALVATIFLQQGACHEAGMEMMQGDHHDQYQQQPCENCGICHLACSAYLGMQQIRTPDILRVAGIVTPALISFHHPHIDMLGIRTPIGINLKNGAPAQTGKR